MDTFTIAMTVLMAISALGQLAVSIAMLSANKRRAIKNWIAWRVDAVTVALLVVFGGRGLLKFALMAEPEKMDYYMMAASAVCVGMGFSVFLHSMAVRYAHGISVRVRNLESVVFHPSEPSEKGSGG